MVLNQDFIQKFDELLAILEDKIDFKGGQIDKSIQEEPTLMGIVAVCWKKKIKLVLYVGKYRLYYYVTRNGEQVSTRYYTTKLDEWFWKNYQNLLNQVKNGDFDYKKTVSDRIAEIVNQRHLTSYMNDTKWKEFLLVMTEKLPLSVPYNYKTLFEKEPEQLYLGTAYDAESFNWYEFKSLEWVKVKPRFYEYVYQGQLLDDNAILHDIEREFLEWMDKFSIPYEYDDKDEVYVIYGYK